jgi:hypothetical protein
MSTRATSTTRPAPALTAPCADNSSSSATSTSSGVGHSTPRAHAWSARTFARRLRRPARQLGRTTAGRAPRAERAGGTAVREVIDGTAQHRAAALHFIDELIPGTVTATQDIIGRPCGS